MDTDCAGTGIAPEHLIGFMAGLELARRALQDRKKGEALTYIEHHLLLAGVERQKERDKPAPSYTPKHW
jgi:hypothetical protein